jgi:hypothetical protein
MSAIDLDLAHKCSQEEARQCIEASLLSLKQEQARWIESASVTWEGAIAKFQLGLRFPFPVGKIPVCGTLSVDATRFRLQGELFWKAAPFKGKIESVIREAIAAKCKDCHG